MVTTYSSLFNFIFCVCEGTKGDGERKESFKGMPVYALS